MAAIVADIKCPSVEGLSISSNQIRALHIAEELAVVPTTITIIAWDETTTPLNDMGREVTVSIAGQTYTGKVVSVDTRKLTHDRNLWEIRYEIANEPYEWGYIGFDFPQQFDVDGVSLTGTNSFVSKLASATGVTIEGVPGDDDFLEIRYSGTIIGAIQYLSQLIGKIPVFETQSGKKIRYVTASEIGNESFQLAEDDIEVGREMQGSDTYDSVIVSGNLNRKPQTAAEISYLSSQYTSLFLKPIEIGLSSTALEITRFTLQTEEVEDENGNVQYYRLFTDFIFHFYYTSDEWVFADPAKLQGSLKWKYRTIPVTFLIPQEDPNTGEIVSPEFAWSTFDTYDAPICEVQAYVSTENPQRIQFGIHGLIWVTSFTHEPSEDEQKYWAIMKLREAFDMATITIDVCSDTECSNCIRIRWPYEITESLSGSTLKPLRVTNNVASKLEAAVNFAKNTIWGLKPTTSYSIFNKIYRVNTVTGIVLSEVDWTPQTGLVNTITVRRAL